MSFGPGNFDWLLASCITSAGVSGLIISFLGLKRRTLLSLFVRLVLGTCTMKSSQRCHEILLVTGASN